MATLKGIWTLGKKIQYKELEQRINGVCLNGGNPFAIIKVYKTSANNNYYYVECLYEDGTRDGFSAPEIYAEHTDAGDETYGRYLTYDFGDIEQTVSEEFYEWWTKYFHKYCPESILGTWKFADEIYATGIPEGLTTITFSDSIGNVYDQIRSTTDEITGDCITEAHNIATNSWTTMMTIPF